MEIQVGDFDFGASFVAHDDAVSAYTTSRMPMYAKNNSKLQYFINRLTKVSLLVHFTCLRTEKGKRNGRN